jgi:hypothetical protein
MRIDYVSWFTKNIQFENGLGNFCSMQKNLDRQLGAIIEYEYNLFTKELIFVHQHIVETIQTENEIKTILLR